MKVSKYERANCNSTESTRADRCNHLPTGVSAHLAHPVGGPSTAATRPSSDAAPATYYGEPREPLSQDFQVIGAANL